MATPETMAVDLETATREQIVEELARRFDQLLVVTTRPSLGKVGNEDREVQVDYRGEFYACWGLAQAANRRFVTREDAFWCASDEDP